MAIGRDKKSTHFAHCVLYIVFSLLCVYCIAYCVMCIIYCVHVYIVLCIVFLSTAYCNMPMSIALSFCGFV